MRISDLKISLPLESIRRFPRGHLSDRYTSYIKDGVIDEVFIGWFYMSSSRGGFLAYAIRRMKREAEHRVFKIVDILSKAAWPQIAPVINKWVNKSTAQTIIVPIPSRFGTSERLAKRLHEQFNERQIRKPAVIYKNLIHRKNRSEIKDILIWTEREKFAKQQFSLKNNKLNLKELTIILTDDVVMATAKQISVIDN